MLVLDDVHWADPASVELLGALLQRPPAAPVLLAVAVRPRQLSERLAAALERAHRAGVLERVGARDADARRGPGASGCRGRRRRRRRRSTRRAAAIRSTSSSSPGRSTARAQIAHAGPDVSLGGRRSHERRRGAGRGARPAVGRGAPRARGGGGGGRSVRARAGGGCRRRSGGGGARGSRRAAAARSRPHHGRPSALPFPPPARPPGGVRVDAGRLADQRARALRRGARGPWLIRLGARPPRRTVCASGRRRRSRVPARGRRDSRSARAGKCRTLVRRSTPPALGDRAERGAHRVARGASRRTRRHRPARRQPRSVTRSHEHRARRKRRRRASGSPPPAPASSTSSAVTRRRTPISRPLSPSSGIRTRRRGPS